MDGRSKATWFVIGFALATFLIGFLALKMGILDRLRSSAEPIPLPQRAANELRKTI